MINNHSLIQQKCHACEGWMKPFTKEQYAPLLSQVKGWVVVDFKKIEKKFELKDFKQALQFVNIVGKLAESENHHQVYFCMDGIK